MSELKNGIERAKREGWSEWIKSAADERAVADGCYFDAKAGEHVCRFFNEHLRHTMGPWAGKAFELLPWQRDQILMPLFGWKQANGLRRFAKGDVFTAKKQGKALAIDTPIPTPTGWATMGSLSVGDQVFDENGLVCSVTAAAEVMADRECYELEFTDGETLVADADHEWVVRSRSARMRFVKATTSQLAERVLIDSAGSEGCNHSIPLAASLSLPEQSLPIPPYVLGAWLGDGETAGARLTCSYKDTEIVEHVVAEGVSAVERVSSNSNSGLFILGSGGRTQAARNDSLQARLRRLGVLGNKHIPLQYLRGSHSQRLSLLQGLMDTDGYVAEHGQCEFTTTLPALRDGIVELIRSLGMKPMAAEGIATCDGKDCGPKYRVKFYGFSDQPVFRLQRKAARLKTRPAGIPRTLNRGIKRIDKCASVPVRCIQVDSPSRMYLAGRSMIPTHNSTLAAGIVNYALLSGGRRAEVYGVAHTRDQAGIIFREAEAMVNSSQSLKKLLEPAPSRKRIVYEKMGSFYQALAGENGAKGAEGINPVLILVDEIHVQRDRVLYDALAYASAARQNSLMLSVSTVGVEDQTTIWWEQYEYAKKLLAGTITDTSRFAYISQADEACKTDDDLCGDPKQWAKAMPSLGVTVTEDKMREYYIEARNSPAKMGNFRRYLLNIPTAQIERCIPMDKWEACSIDKHGGVWPDLSGRDCIGGLDVASHEDLSCFVLYFPPESEGEPGYLKSWFFCPEEKIRQREQKQQGHYVQWAADGDLTKTPGARIEHGVILEVINQRLEDYNVLEIAYDQWNADAIVNPLTMDGVEMVQINQGFNGMSHSCSTFLDLVTEERLIHDANPVMTWCCSNVAADTMHDAIKFNKSKSADKIDGVIAAAMAIGRATQLSQDTAYDKPGQGVVLL